MKNLFILCGFFLLTTLTAIAQQEVAIAKTYLSQNAAKQSLEASDIAEMTISSQYLSPTTGWYHIYFTQTYQSIEVYNGMLNTTLQNGEVKYVGNTFVPNIASLIPKNTTSSQSISPLQAVQIAAKAKNLTTDKLQQINTVFINDNKDGEILKTTFVDKTLSDENIQVKKYWLPYETTENGKSVTKVALTWNVQFLTKDHQNQWNMHIDVASGEILRERDDIIHCSFGESPKAESTKEGHTHLAPTNPAGVAVANSYNVFDYPLESPNHGSRSVVVSPYARFVPASTFPGVTNGWHNDGTTDYTTTRGNNVWAKEDIAADNETTIGASPASATLEFNYPYSQTLNSAVANRDAAITNLFYWNNVLHDVLWKYGFDEPSGNFQNDNQGQGGAGGDFVQADAQDGSGVNNANFNTPIDGGNGRMQMFLGTFSNDYQVDTDFDNGVISHEYGHGWSNRLTGGPANSGCLQNVEQAGEGWSDYIALMTTTDWASLTPTVANANIPRGIASYFFGQPTTGNGLRPFRYSYDMVNINPTVTYAQVGNTAFRQPHGIGSIWATMIWDMTWEIILQDNFIAPNIYDVPANILDYEGNIAALKLVNEGLRLQPCSPSFVQARDAILKADDMLFGGRYHCAIVKAFARRGLGGNASTGTTSNDRIVIEDFTPILPKIIPPTINTICSGQPLSYSPTFGYSGSFTFTWTRAAVAGVSNTASSGTGTINETLVNTTNSPIEIEYKITASPTVCGSSSPLPQTVKFIVGTSVVNAGPNIVFCSSTNAGIINLSDKLAPVVRWESSIDNFVNNSIIANTSNSLNVNNVSQTIQYRAVIQNFNCETYSTPAKITINSGRLYVKKDASGLNNGQSWLNALTDLQFAPGSGCEVWVAKGTYTPAVPNGDRNQSFILLDNVKIYGGFLGTESLLSDRNYSLIHTANSTVLSGDLNGNDGPNFANNAENSNRVVTMSNVSNNTRLDGFTITGGNNLLSDFRTSGGGVSLLNSSPVIVNCNIVSNYAFYYGGGLSNISGQPNLENCKFLTNRAGSLGGAINNWGLEGMNQTINISNCTFIANSGEPSSNGTILFNYSSSGVIQILNLNNCSFSGNTATNSYAMFNQAEPGCTINTIMKNCVFFNNGGIRTFYNFPGNLRTYTNSANYCFFESTVIDYSGTNNVISNISPFVSPTDLHLNCSSLAVNSGTNVAVLSKDLDGNPRPYASTAVDMGAYELQGGPVTPPTSVSLSSAAICLGQIATLTAACTSGEVKWYNSPTGETTIGTGQLLSVSPSANTTYYVTCKDEVCSAPLVAVGQILVSTPSSTLNLTSDFTTNAIQIANTTLTATNKIINPARVTYKAGNSVTLNQGFEVKSGSVFEANIGGCENLAYNGLVAYYPFNGNTNDETGNGFTGVVNGPILTTDRFGNTNKAYAFDGVDDFIRVTQNASLNAITKTTISFWTYHNQVNRTTDGYDWQAYFSKDTYGKWFTSMLCTDPSGCSGEQPIILYHPGLSTPDSRYNWSSISPNVWYHVTVSNDGTFSKFYINGVLVHTENETGSVTTNTSDIILGRCLTPGLPYPLDGKLDDIRIYNRAITDAEVQAIYNAEKP